MSSINPLHSSAIQQHILEQFTLKKKRNPKLSLQSFQRRRWTKDVPKPKNQDTIIRKPKDLGKWWLK
jgi:hypothetical protein